MNSIETATVAIARDRLMSRSRPWRRFYATSLLVVLAAAQNARDFGRLTAVLLEFVDSENSPWCRRAKIQNEVYNLSRKS